MKAIQKSILLPRLGFTNDVMADMYGPLTELIGIWSGKNGVNLIAVPDQKGGFNLLIAPYYETITVTALNSPTPNRGLKTIENIPTLMYTLMIHNADDDTLMHAENGIWELLDPSNNNGFNLARITTVPHGDAVMALGKSSSSKGRPDLNTQLSSLPTPVNPLDKFHLGYITGYGSSPIPGFRTGAPNFFLSEYLDNQEKLGRTVINSTALTVSTLNNGGISNIPSIDKNANATTFNATFWLETVKDAATGKTFPQLQYSQEIMIDFPANASADKFKSILIHWPHINVNTLLKQ